MEKRFYLFLKFFFFFIIFTLLFYVLENGVFLDSPYKSIIPSLLGGLTVVMMFKKNFRKLIFFFSIFVLGLMVVIYLFSFLEIAKIVGDFGFSLLMISTIFYIPQIIKNGYIEKF